MRILLVEDDVSAAKSNALIFSSIGASVDIAGDAAEGLEYIRAFTYDLAVVDVSLPDMTGHALVRAMRQSHDDTPALMLTGLSGLQVKVDAFSAGADDFLCKPAAPAELIARVRAVVRRKHGVCQKLLRFGALELDQDEHTVTVNGTEVHLAPKEYVILELILLHRHKTVSKTTILDHLYGGRDEPNSRTVDVFVCMLRQKLAAAGITQVIRTIPKIGYTLARADNQAVSAMTRTNGRKPMAAPEVLAGAA
jgi:two-component system cell cycle response regulator CtrA